MATTRPERPRIRPVEVIPFEEAGKRSFLLQDPAGYVESPLQLSPAALLLVGLCDGSRTPDEVRADFASRAGHALSAEELAGFLETMDRALLLDSPSFQAHRAQHEQEFAALEWRPASHAGTAYEGDPARLGSALDRWLAGGVAGGRAGDRLRALLAPHIDFHRGGAGYGKAYAALIDRETPEVVVLLGTGHAAEEGRFILCDKGFRTARGDLPVDRDFLGRLERRLARSHRRGLFAHRREHSIEFQAVWLAHLFSSEPRPAIVPILGTTFDDLFEEGAGPTRHPETGDFLGALRETWREERRRVLVVVGADLAHVGPRFGDAQPNTPEFLAEVRARDAAALDGAKSGSADRFLAAVAEHRNRHRICSVAGIFAALHTVRADGGDLLAYEQAVDPSGQLAVTFAGMALYGGVDGPGLARTRPLKRALRQGTTPPRRNGPRP